MIIIFGTKGVTKNLDSGTFHCPNCAAPSPYILKSVRKHGHLFFIPLIAVGDAATYVECQTCKSTFDEGDQRATIPRTLPDYWGFKPRVQGWLAIAFLASAAVARATSDGWLATLVFCTLAGVVFMLASHSDEPGGKTGPGDSCT